MSAPETIAIVPVKSLEAAKSRLADVLAPEARWRLVLAMLGDVLTAVMAVPAVTRTIVVTCDAEVAAAARGHGAEIVHESQPISLNGALRTALHVGCARPDTRCLILPADVPLATSDEIAALLTPPMETPHRVTIAPSHDGGGTNALVLMDHDVMGPSFGPDSFRRHLDLAEALHLNPRVVRLPGLGFDVDTPDDLRRLCRIERYRWLEGEWLHEPQASPSLRAHQSA